MRYIKYFKFYILQLLLKLGVLNNIHFTTSKKTGNTKIRLPVYNGIGVNNLTDFHERGIKNLLDSILPQRSVFVDVGVNIGQTIINLLTLNKSIVYYGFEPDPLCYQYTNELIRINQLSGFHLFPVGLSDRPDVVKLYADRPYATGASIIENFRADRKFHNYIQYVPVMPGDDIFAKEQLSGIDVLKIDVEGAELEVIKGLRKTITQYLPLIILEILPVYSLDNPRGVQRKTRQDALLAELTEQYETYLIDEEKQQVKHILTIEVHSSMSETNYLFIPKKKKSSYNNLFA